MGIKIALIGIDNGMSEPPRQMNICGADDERVAILFDAHDPL